VRVEPIESVGQQSFAESEIERQVMRDELILAFVFVFVFVSVSVRRTSSLSSSFVVQRRANLAELRRDFVDDRSIVAHRVDERLGEQR
jgi:hypothetical protein